VFFNLIEKEIRFHGFSLANAFTARMAHEADSAIPSSLGPFCRFEEVGIGADICTLSGHFFAARNCC
jgi:hypothetical protein